ncbi:tetratricopeptide repeat protein [bacterium]|nr:tetratricopeptide repeat protein [bacterium]
MTPLSKIFGKTRAIESLLSKGDSAVHSGNYKVAEGFYDDALTNLEKLKPTSVVNQQIIMSLVGLAQAIDGQGRRAEVYQYFDRALEIKGNHDQLFDILTKIIKPDQELNESGLRVLKKAYEKKKSNEFLLKIYAQALWDNQIFDQRSLEIYDRAHQADPNFPKAIKGLGKALIENARWDDRALKIHRRLQKLEPENKEHLKNIALCYANQDPPPDESYQVMLKARELYPDEEAIFDGLTKYYLNNQEMREAIFEHFKKAYEKKPSRMIAEKMLPYLLRNHDTSDTAISVYEQHFATHPKREQILSILSEHYIKNNKSDDLALEIVETLFKLNPRARDNTLYLAMLYAKDGKFDATALQVYESVVDEEEGDTPPEIISALANTYLKENRKDSHAREIYFRELELKPHNTEVLKTLGIIALSKKHLDDRDIRVLTKLFKAPSTQNEFRINVANSLVQVLTKRRNDTGFAQEVFGFLWQKGSELPSEAVMELALKHAKSKSSNAQDIRLFESALKNRFNSTIAWALAKLYIKNSRDDSTANTLYMRVLQDDPTNSSIINFLAPKILDKKEIKPKYFPIIQGLIETNPKLLLEKVSQTHGMTLFIKTGRHHLIHGDFDKAFKVLNFANKNFKDPVIEYLLGIALLEKGDLSTASRVFEHLVKSAPQNPLYQYRLGHLALLEKKFDIAEKAFKKLFKSYPNHELLNARMGMLYEAQGNWKKAETHYKKLLESSGEFSNYGLLRLAVENFRHNRDDSFEEKLKKHIDESYFGQLIARTLAKRRFDIGVRAFREEKLQEAVHHLERAAKYVDTAELNRIYAEAHYRYGIQLMKRNDTVNAEKHFKQAQEIDPKSGGPSLLLGLMSHINNKPIKARSYYQYVINNHSNLRDYALIYLGKLELKNKNYNQANENFNMALEYERVYPEALLGRMISFYINSAELDTPRILENRDFLELYEKKMINLPFLGVIFFRGGRYDQGINVLEKGVKKNPDVESLFLLGLLNIYNQKHKIAFHYWSDIPSLLGKSKMMLDKKLEILYALGYYYLEEEMIEKATEVFDEIKRFSPKSLDLDIAKSLTLIHRGYLEAKARNVDRAINSWKTALKFNQSSLMALQNLSLAYIIKTKPQEALDNWTHYFDLLERKVQRFPDENSVVELNESRRILNTLNMVAGDEKTFSLAVRKEILIDNIESVNHYYWTLNLEKGATADDAKTSYFRLIRTYTPEKHAEEFMQIEEAYQFFLDDDRFKKAQPLIFNGFNLHKTLRLIKLPFKWGVPELPSIMDSCDRFIDPRESISNIKFQSFYHQISFDKVLPDYPTHEFVIDDYLTDW